MPGDEAQPDTSERRLILDELDERLDAFNAFRKSDSAQADAILGELGANDRVDRDIVLQLAGRRPLGHPDRFPEAHAMAVRSLEVLDRNGARGVKVRGLGPVLGPGAAYFVQLVTRFIVRNHQRTLVDNMRRLYARREANALPDDPNRWMLRRARRHADLVVDGFKRNPLGIPTFLLGGAVLSTFVSSIQSAVVGSVDSRWVRIVVAAAVSRSGRRLVDHPAGRGHGPAADVLTTEKPFQSLYETIGRCGDPPRDQSKLFALIATILLVAGWVIVPIGIAGGFFG